MVTIDSETLFNTAAAVVATIAVLFFILNVDWGFSPVSKIALVVAFLTGIFAITQRTSDHQLTLLGYGVIVTSVVGLFFELVSTFSVENTLTVLGLLVIAATLFGLRSQLDVNNHFVTGQQAASVLGVIAILAVGILMVDIVTGSLAYELQPESQIEVPETRHDEIQIATIVVNNPTPFPERVETPNYAVCTAGNWSAYQRSTPEGESQHPVRAHLSVRDGYNEHVMPFSEKTYPVLLHLDGTTIQGETFPVKRTSSCPDTETGSPYIAIYEDPDGRTYGRPV